MGNGMRDTLNSRERLDTLCSELNIKDVKFYLNDSSCVSLDEIHGQAYDWIYKSFKGLNKKFEFKECDQAPPRVK